MKTLILISLLIFSILSLYFIVRAFGERRRTQEGLPKRVKKAWPSLKFEIFDRIIFLDKEWQKQEFNLVGKKINLDIVNHRPDENPGAYSASIGSISADKGRLLVDTNSSFALEDGTIEAHLLLEAQPYGNAPGSYSITSSTISKCNITGGTGAYEMLRGNVSIRGIVKETQSNKLTIKCEVNIQPDEEKSA